MNINTLKKRFNQWMWNHQTKLPVWLWNFWAKRFDCIKKAAPAGRPERQGKEPRKIPCFNYKAWSGKKKGKKYEQN